MKTTAISAAVAAIVLAAGPVAAQTMATTEVDLNLRAGPGTQYEVVGVLPAGMEADVTGCLDGASWCEVSYDGMQAWASGDYLDQVADGDLQPIYVVRGELGVPTVTYENTDEQTDNAIAAGGVGAAAAYALAGGPAAIAAATALGVLGGAAITPSETEAAYIASNPVDPIMVDGEVVVGAGIPEGVDLFTIPDSQYAYTSLNGQLVLVEPQQRQVVYIMR